MYFSKIEEIVSSAKNSHAFSMFSILGTNLWQLLRRTPRRCWAIERRMGRFVYSRHRVNNPQMLQFNQGLD
jgi:hypothetical protein